ncbi:hypothetical protein ACLOJK_016610 [Asimina triloba]
MGGEKKEISQNLGEEAALVSTGSVDYHGKIADKKTTGRWLAAPFIIVNEVAERLAFYAIAVNMVSYLVLESLPAAPPTQAICKQIHLPHAILHGRTLTSNSS